MLLTELRNQKKEEEIRLWSICKKCGKKVSGTQELKNNGFFNNGLDNFYCNECKVNKIVI